MNRLNFKDTQQILKSIEQLYCLDDLNRFEVKALVILDRLIQNEFPTFFNFNPRSRHLSYRFLEETDFNLEQEPLLVNPCQEPQILDNLPLILDAVSKILDFASQQPSYTLESVERESIGLIDYDNEILVLLANCSTQTWNDLVQENAYLVGFALYRPQPKFSDRDRLVLTLLRPHLWQAYQNTQQFQLLQQDSTLLQQSYKQELEEQTLHRFNSLQLLGLSPREAEILAWVMRGKDNKAIAAQLGIHIGTVRKHLEHIYLKLGVQSRTEAIAQALEKLGFLNSPPFL